MAEETQVPLKLARLKRAPDALKVVAKGRVVAPWDDLYHGILTCSWSVFVLLVLAWFLATNSLYAGLYLLQPGAVTEVNNFEAAFYFSVESLTTIGFGVMTPTTRYAHILVTSEALVGILSTALITGITFAKFARPKARVLFAEPIVIGRRDGVETMTFRLANFRHNSIVEATIRIILLVPSVTKEGETIRTPIDLKLVRERSATFVLTWLVFHVVDEASPFFGGEPTLARLREQGAELWVALSGMDDTVGQNIFSRYRYSIDDVVMNARFLDVLAIEPDGTRVVDYHNFHLVEPQLPLALDADTSELVVDSASSASN
jgi:inward rectifier potassium channel